MPWARSAELPIGQIWSRFKGRERDGKPAYLYQIRDMDDNIQKTCLDMMQEVFLRDEPLCEVLGIDKDPVSIATIRENWEGFVSQNVSLACFTEVDGQPDELVGFNIVFVKSIDDEDEDISQENKRADDLPDVKWLKRVTYLHCNHYEPPKPILFSIKHQQVKGESWKKLLRILTKAESLVNIFQYYNVDKYLTSSGLTVVPGHRGQNIGARLIEAREHLAKAFDIKASATVFTATTSQVLAAKCGYEKLAVLEYRDMLEEGIDLTNCTVEFAILMGTQYGQ